MNKNILSIGLIILFILSIVSPVILGYTYRSNMENMVVKRHHFNSYQISELSEELNMYIQPLNNDFIKSKALVDLGSIYTGLDRLVDSPWPMYCHDTRHTGQSPYSTAENTGFEKWQLYIKSGINGGIVIDDNGVIYYGYGDLYAAYPNGTVKWCYDTHGTIQSSPSINEDGTIYVGIESASDKYFYAINPNGTLKWRHGLPGSVYSSSSAIGDDGTIYFGLECGYPWYGYIYALYPNGTLRWKYRTDHVVYSSPAIGDDGTIYCGSHDTYLYALYPNNGTLKWKYKTGNWIRTSPCIADDSNIYVVSLDNYLHAVYPNGTLKWKTDVGAGTSPTISQDGIIYCGYNNLYAINPTNGSVKWTFDVQGKIRGATPCNSVDGTIFLGNSDGSDIVAVNPDGTEKWRASIGGDVESAPAIGKDGTVYIGDGMDDGYLHAFGEVDSNAPSSPSISGQTSGTAGTEYDYTFKSTSSLGRDVYYYIEWDDGSIKNWFGPYDSGVEVTVGHSWSKQGTYTIKARAKDTENLWGPWGELTVIMPRNKPITNSLFLRFLERYSLLEIVLSRINL